MSKKKKENMKDQVITFEVAKLAKNKGLPQGKSRLGKYNMIGEIIKPAAGYGGGVPMHEEEIFAAPTQSLLQKWLREEHKVHIELIWDVDIKIYWFASISKIGDVSKNNCTDMKRKSTYNYEDALEVGLEYALALI